MRPAFTLIELLVVIVVVATLLGLITVGLGQAMKSTATVHCLANIRSCGQSMAIYASDYGDAFPRFAQRRVRRAFFNGGVPLDYLSQSYHWPMALRGYLGEDRALSPVQLCPKSPVKLEAFGRNASYSAFLAQYPPGYTFTSEYWMSYAMITAPKAWTAGGRIEPRSLRTVRWSETAQPALKGLLLEPRATHLGEDPYGAAASISIFRKEGQHNAFNVAFVDGHAQSLRYAKLRPGFPSPGMWPDPSAPVLATRDGIRGFDFQ